MAFAEQFVANAKAVLAEKHKTFDVAKMRKAASQAMRENGGTPRWGNTATGHTSKVAGAMDDTTKTLGVREWVCLGRILICLELFATCADDAVFEALRVTKRREAEEKYSPGYQRFFAPNDRGPNKSIQALLERCWGMEVVPKEPTTKFGSWYSHLMPRVRYIIKHYLSDDTSGSGISGCSSSKRWVRRIRVVL